MLLYDIIYVKKLIMTLDTRHQTLGAGNWSAVGEDPLGLVSRRPNVDCPSHLLWAKHSIVSCLYKTDMSLHCRRFRQTYNCGLPSLLVYSERFACWTGVLHSSDKKTRLSFRRRPSNIRCFARWNCQNFKRLHSLQRTRSRSTAFLDPRVWCLVSQS